MNDRLVIVVIASPVRTTVAQKSNRFYLVSRHGQLKRAKRVQT
jgi:hypothetical protein